MARVGLPEQGCQRMVNCSIRGALLPAMPIAALETLVETTKAVDVEQKQQITAAATAEPAPLSFVRLLGVMVAAGIIRFCPHFTTTTSPIGIVAAVSLRFCYCFGVWCPLWQVALGKLLFEVFFGRCHCRRSGVTPTAATTIGGAADGNNSTGPLVGHWLWGAVSPPPPRHPCQRRFEPRRCPCPGSLSNVRHYRLHVCSAAAIARTASPLAPLMLSTDATAAAQSRKQSRLIS